MSVFSINRIGSKISTQIRQASFDLIGIEANMYTGEQVVALYGYNIKPSTWCQISWSNLSCSSCDDIHTFGIAGRDLCVLNSFDYLLAVAIEAVFPQVTLANTPCPVPFTITLPTGSSSTSTKTYPLYFSIADGTNGIPAGTIVLGTSATLTSQSGLGLTNASPLISYSPRHLVSWSQYALLAALEWVTLRVNGIEFERFDRNALYNALQFRTRQDVFPISVEEATSFRATQVSATVGNGVPTILGGIAEDARYKAFTVPFSFSTSAFADRGQDGKHLSAFPILLCCDSSICMEVETVRDLRDLLVLQEECLVDYSCSPIVIAVMGSLFGSSPTTSNSNIVISNGVTDYTIAASNISSTPLNSSNNILGTTSNITFSTSVSAGASSCQQCPPCDCNSCHSSNCNNAHLPRACSCQASFGCNTGCGSVSQKCGCNSTPATTARTFSPFTLGSLGIHHIQQTREYAPVTRYQSVDPECTLGREIDYSKWIIEDTPLRLRIHARALGANVTDLERGFSKNDCRNRKFLYEAYSYSCDKTARPGSEHCIKLCRAPGQFKYAFSFAENETSRLQGQFFNYTNSTEFTIVADSELAGTKFVFEGHDSLLYFKQRIDGYDDYHARSKFITYVDNPLFAQRAPRITGLHIFPRYANWINSIYPDGSINLETIKCAELEVKTTPSSLFSSCCCPNYGKPNTIRYHLNVISVLWRIAIFDIGI